MTELPDFATVSVGEARAIAREEIASLAGLMLRRLQNEGPTRVQEHNILIGMLSKHWGEVLRDFGATRSEPGDDETVELEPGDKWPGEASDK